MNGLFRIFLTLFLIGCITTAGCTNTDPIVGSWVYYPHEDHEGPHNEIQFDPDGSYLQTFTYCLARNETAGAQIVPLCRQLAPVQGTWKANGDGRYRLTSNGKTQYWEYSASNNITFNQEEREVAYSR